MHDSKLMLLLRSLDVAEFKRLGLFLQSPFYNRDPHVTALYNEMKPFHPVLSSPKLKKEDVYARLYPKQPFDLNKMRKLMSAFTTLVENFLVVLEGEHEAYRDNILLAKAYNRHNLSANFEKETRALIQVLQHSSKYSPAHHHILSQLNQDLFFHPDTNKHEVGQEMLVSAMQHLDQFYALSKLRLAAEMRTRENILAEKHNIQLLDEVTAMCRQSIATENPLCEIYLQLIDLHEDKINSTSLKSAVDLFESLLLHIDSAEQKNLLHHLVNHCIRLINRGDKEHRRQLFDLYRLGAENNLLHEGRQMSELTFSNIVAIASSLKEFEWAGDFIRTHAILLPPENREEIEALSLALWHFNLKEYGEAERRLLGHGFSNMLNLLKSRCLLIRIYYELFLLDNRSFIFLNDQIDAFEKMIRRHKKIAQSKSVTYLNFLRFTRKLAQKKYAREDLTKLKSQLEVLTAVSYKDWLLEKMDER
jgi:hypothetical protein